MKHFSRDWRTFVPDFSRTAAACLPGLILLAPMGLAACTVVERPNYPGHHQSFGSGFHGPVVVVPAPRSHHGHGHHRRDRHDRRYHHR